MIPGAHDIKRMAELVRFLYNHAQIDSSMVLKGVKRQITEEMNRLPPDTPYYELKIQMLRDAREYLEELAEEWIG